MKNVETYAGVDVSKETLDIAVHPRQQFKSFRNNEMGINGAVTYLKSPFSYLGSNGSHRRS
jgi:transposase